MNTPLRTLREKAAQHYCSRLNGAQSDWVESGSEEDLTEGFSVCAADVRDLFALLVTVFDLGQASERSGT